MAGRPMTVRLLDPPLHEFLPSPADLPEGSPARARVEALRESSPMLGTRGVRLGLLFPALYEMQVRALLTAAGRVAERGVPTSVEIMVPLVAYERELELALRPGRGRDRVRPRRLLGGLHDRAAARVLPCRQHRRARRLLLLREPTTSLRPASGSRAGTSKGASCRATSTWRSSTARPSRRSTPRRAAAAHGRLARAQD